MQWQRDGGGAVFASARRSQEEATHTHRGCRAARCRPPRARSPRGLLSRTKPWWSGSTETDWARFRFSFSSFFFSFFFFSPFIFSLFSQRRYFQYAAVVLAVSVPYRAGLGVKRRPKAGSAQLPTGYGGYCTVTLCSHLCTDVIGCALYCTLL